MTAVACTVDLWKRDMEVKILIGCSEDDIQIIERFLNNTEFLRCTVLERNLEKME